MAGAANVAEKPSEENYLTPAEAAAYIRRAPRTLEEWRINKTGPVYLKLGASKRSNVMYRKRDLDAWMAGFEVKPEKPNNLAD